MNPGYDRATLSELVVDTSRRIRVAEAEATFGTDPNKTAVAIATRDALRARRSYLHAELAVTRLLERQKGC